MPEPILPEQPRREIRNYSGKFFKFRLTTQTRPLVISICLVRKRNKHTFVGKHSADDGKVETEMRKWLRQQSKDFYAAGFDALVKRWDKWINFGGIYIDK
jgi:hypothetical protein